MIGVLKPYVPDEDAEAAEYDGSDEELFQAIENGTLDEYANKWLTLRADQEHKPLIAQANRTLNRATRNLEKHAVHNQQDHGNRYGSLSAHAWNKLGLVMVAPAVSEHAPTCREFCSPV